LPEQQRRKLTNTLMDALRAIHAAHKAESQPDIVKARAAVNVAKVALGGRGEVWWADGAPDYNRRLAKNTPYAAWYAEIENNAGVN
jgi:hypothetical protein